MDVKMSDKDRESFLKFLDEHGLNFKPSLDFDVLTRVLKSISTGGVLSDDDYRRVRPKVKPCDKKQFNNLHNSLESIFNLSEYAEVEDERLVFPEWEQWFEYDGVLFTWWLKAGQGVCKEIRGKRAAGIPFCQDGVISLRADGNHVVPSERVAPVRSSSRKGGEETVHLTEDLESVFGVFNRLLGPHGLVFSHRCVRKDGGVYVRVAKISPAQEATDENA